MIMRSRCSSRRRPSSALPNFAIINDHGFSSVGANLVFAPNRAIIRIAPTMRDRIKPVPNQGHPSFPPGTPASLQQIVEVIHLVLKRDLSRPEATYHVAKSRNVAPQTVLDKYCRQLGLKAYEIDRLIAQPDLSNLKTLLNQKFPNHQSLISKYLNQ
jgi:hypothetical protein